MNNKKNGIFAAVMALCVFFTGCAEKTSADNETAPVALSGYRAEKIFPADDIEGELVNTCFIGSRAYMLSSTYDGETEKYYLSSFLEDGTNQYSEQLDFMYASKLFEYNGNAALGIIEFSEDSGASALKIVTFGEDCKVKDTYDITPFTELFENGEFYMRDGAQDANGGLYLGSYGAAGYIDSGLSPVSGCSDEDLPGNLVRCGNGKVYAFGSNYNGGFDLYDIGGESCEVAFSYGESEGDYKTCTAADGDENADLYFCDYKKVYSYDIESGSAEEIFSLDDAGLVSSEAGSFTSDGEGGFIFIGTDYRSGKPVISHTTLKELPSVEKTVITVGGYSYDFGTDFEYQAVKFSGESDKYTIKLNRYDDVEELNTDIISGNCPDIILLNESMPVNSYINKGLLADLYEYIDADGEISRETFLPGLLSACETGGKLYRFTDSFMIRTAIGKASFFREGEKLDYDKLAEAAAGLPESADVFPGCSKSLILEYALSMVGGKFVDYDNKVSHFDSEEFVEMLEFANKFGADITDDYFQGFDFENIYRDDLGLMAVPLLTDYRDIAFYEREVFGESVTAAGFPCKDGLGAAFDCAHFGINALSENKDAAWEFLRTLLLPDYQEHTEAFSVRPDCLEKQGQEALNRDINEYDDYMAICYFGDMCYGVSSSPIKVSEEDIRRMNEVIYSAEYLIDFDPKLMDIIRDEAEGYFGGSRTAGEAAENIKSRADILLTE